MSPAALADRALISGAYHAAFAKLRCDEHLTLLPTSRDVHAELVHAGVEIAPSVVRDHLIAAGLRCADLDGLAEEPTRKVPPVR